LDLTPANYGSLNNTITNTYNIAIKDDNLNNKNNIHNDLNKKMK